MNPKIKHSLLAIAAIIILCGCESKPTKQIIQTTYDEEGFSTYKTGAIWVDTITIHGKPHEILLRRTSNTRDAVGGMMHSPECWCGKGGGR